MGYIQSVTTALPRFSYSKDDLFKVGEFWLANRPEDLKLFTRFIQSSQIDKRYFAVPIEEILTLNGMSQRAATFQQEGVVLGRTALEGALKYDLSEAAEVKNLIFTSCTVPSIPAIDVEIAKLSSLSPYTNRIPIYQHGCAGGAAGLALASKLSQNNQLTALLAVELCSLIYQKEDFERGSLVGSAIFGDGAACVLLDSRPSALRIVASQSFLLPNSRDLMGYNIEDDGPHLRLNRELPNELATLAPKLVNTFLSKYSLTSAQIAWWLIHPGGSKILGTLTDLFKLNPQQLHWSWEILRRYGNMSSAAILFVLEAFMRDKPWKKGERSLMIGIGPGLTVELLLLEST